MDMSNMVSPSLNIDGLPSEILMSMLTPLNTKQLLPLARINRRFHDLTLRIIHTRLLKAASLPERQLLLECYHPAAKTSSPHLQCNYLGTDGLHGYEEDEAEEMNFARLGQLYTRFRPVVQNSDKTPRLDVNLDDCETFSQLCCSTSLVKGSARRGLFASHINVNDGVVRVFRRWLRERASGTGNSREDILWTDRHRNVGFRFRVREDLATRTGPAVWTQKDEDDRPVSYELEYQEVVVRTSKLLINMENSEAQETAQSNLGYVVETGNKVPCKAQQMLFWMPPAYLYDRQLWGGQAPSVLVGGA